MNPKRNTLRHIILKVAKAKHNEGTLKAREKQFIMYKRNPVSPSVGFSAETLWVEGVAGHVQNAKKKKISNHKITSHLKKNLCYFFGSSIYSLSLHLAYDSDPSLSLIILTNIITLFNEL